MKRPIYYSPFLLIILLPLFYGQTLPALSSLSVDELEQKSRDICLPEEQAAYLDALIKKVKQNGDSLRLADAYHYLCSDFHAYTEMAVAYADSLIEMTKHWTHKTYPAHAYLQKGIQLYFLNQYYEATENYLTAKAFFLQHKAEEAYPKLYHVYKKYTKNKENLITKLEKQLNHYILWIWILTIFCIVLVIDGFFYLRWINKIHMQRFDALIQKNSSDPRSETKANGKRKKKVKLPEKFIREILNKLERFEKEKGYLHQNLSVSSLAKNLNINTNYLSNIVNTYKKQNFPQYVNDLRIDYSVHQLKISKTLKKYTIKALAEEFGFNTQECFRCAFEEKTGICPSYFLEQFEKKRDKEQSP